MVRTRFAPSPSGRLHLGHILAALAAQLLARTLAPDQHECLLRIEDIDTTRCRQEFTNGILEDLAWLGLHFDGTPVRQSTRMSQYLAALEQLQQLGVLYPCFCTRKDVQAAIAQLANAPQGEDSAWIDPYPGTCNELAQKQAQQLINKGVPHAWRLSCKRAAQLIGNTITWHDLHLGTQNVQVCKLGDAILARKDFPTSYHLAVVVDDAAQGITHITRGRDLVSATGIHRALQLLLGYPQPVWSHHRLLTDAQGVRLAKRNNALSIAHLREQGLTPQEVLAMVTE